MKKGLDGNKSLYDTDQMRNNGKRDIEIILYLYQD